MSQEERNQQAPRRTSASQGQRTAPSQRASSQRNTSSQRTSSSSRRKRSRMGLGGAMVYVMVVIGSAVLLAGFGWMCASDVLALNKPPVTATITVSEDDSVSDVAKKLKTAGLVDHPWLFNLFSAFTGGKEDITDGTFTLSSDMDFSALINGMGKGSTTRATVSVTIPEGYTALQVFQKLADAKVCTIEELTETAANHAYKFSFLQDIPLGDYRRLDGYLFPDTYTFYQGEDPVYALNKMLLRFDEKFTPEMRQKVADSGHSIHEIIIIASLIEKETTGDDQTTIASVIFNRLNSNYPKLEIDATVQYILPERKENLTYADLQIDDPYNTYVYPGLPAGPIANPGEASIRAAMNPAKTNSHFYALGDDGAHHFFKTYQEQQNFIATQKRYQSR